MEQLKQTDFRWHAEQSNVPGLSATEMKEFLDAPVHTLMDKVNEVIGEVEAVDLSTLRQELGTKANAEALSTLEETLRQELGTKADAGDLGTLREANTEQNIRLSDLEYMLTTETEVRQKSDDNLDNRISGHGEQIGAMQIFIDSSISELSEQQEKQNEAINELVAQQASTAPVFIDHFDLTVEEINNIYTQCILKDRALVIKEGAGKYVCNQVYANGTGDQIAFIYIKCSSSGEVTFHRHGYVLESGAHYPMVYTFQGQG